MGSVLGAHVSKPVKLEEEAIREDVGREWNQWEGEGGRTRWKVAGRRLVNSTFNTFWRGSRKMNYVEMVDGRGWKCDKTEIQLSGA